MVKRMTTMKKSYTELLKYDDFYDRFQYLRLNGIVGDETFGAERLFNQVFYKSQEWKECRRLIIIRDNGYDLGVKGRDIGGRIYVHHINPVTVDQVLSRDPRLFDPENLISTSFNTHQAIHYGDIDLLIEDYKPRKPNDTSPWLEE